MKELTQDQLLANEVMETFRQFMYMPNEHSFTVSTLWVMHTHLRSQSEVFLPYITPRLYFGSKIAGCGKSLATEITTRLSHNGEMVLEPTTPGITTLMNEQATLGFDEIDTYFGRGTAKQSMRAILNGGYKKGASVPRQRSDAPDRQNIHGPICLNGKNAALFMHDEKFETLRTRSICILLEQKPEDIYVDRFNPELHERRLTGLMHRLKKWGVTNAPSIIAIPSEGLIPDKIVNRAEEIWTVLFRIALHLGQDWFDRCEKAARAFVLGEWEKEERQVLTPAEELLVCVQATFTDADQFLTTTEVLSRLRENADNYPNMRPMLMDEWQGGRSAEMGLARALAIYGVTHVRQRVNGDLTWGYSRSDVGCPAVPVQG